MEIKKEWFKNVKEFYNQWNSYGLNEIQQELLTQCCDQLNIMEKCKKDINKTGLYYLTSSGQQKKNVSASILKDTTTSFQQLLKLLSDTLEVE